MNVLFIILTAVLLSLQNVVRKQFNIQTAAPAMFTFNGVACLAAALVFLIASGGELHFTWDIVPYALLFSLCFAVATAFSLMAIRCGPLSFTSLAISYSLVIPTLAGILLHGDEVGVLFYIGMALLLTSLLLINNYKGTGETRFSLKWVVCTTLAFLGNGLCSTVQPYQQRVFNGAYKSEFMILALLLPAVVFLTISLLTERPRMRATLKSGVHWMVIFGSAVGAVNLLVMILSNRMNTSLMFPLISGGCLILTSGISIFGYKEKLTKLQLLGLCMGISAVVLLNI